MQEDEDFLNHYDDFEANYESQQGYTDDWSYIRQKDDYHKFHERNNDYDYHEEDQPYEENLDFDLDYADDGY